MNKNLLVTTILSIFVANVQAEEKIKLTGYIDASYSASDVEGAENTSTLAVDNFHLNVDYKLSDKLSVSGDVAGGSEEDFDLEQANFTYSINDNVSLTAGKFLSAQGWEAFHAPDMYQNSYSATLLYPAMMNAIGATYADENFSVYGAVMSSAWDSKDTDMEDMAYEGAIKITAIPNITIHLGGVSEDFAAGYTQSLINVWASYRVENLVLAVEYNSVSDWGREGNDGSGWLMMANYAFTEKVALTLRTSGLDIDDTNNGAITNDTKWTISPSYAINDNWVVLAEYNVLTNDVDNIETAYFALESTISF
jgi:hypothetical protein